MRFATLTIPLPPTPYPHPLCPTSQHIPINKVGDNRLFAFRMGKIYAQALGTGQWNYKEKFTVERWQEWTFAYLSLPISFNSSHIHKLIKKVIAYWKLSVNKILWCDHPNETSFTVLLHGTICFLIFYKILMKFGVFLEFWFWALLGVKGCGSRRHKFRTCQEAPSVEVQHSSWLTLYSVNRILSFCFPRLQWPAILQTHTPRNLLWLPCQIAKNNRWSWESRTVHHV